MSISKKIRIDQLLVERGLAPTRSRAQSLIMAGVVTVGTERVNKASESFLADADIHVREADHPYVGRGGLKLKAALDYFKISVEGKICLDVGASTGGFTDCLLQSGAKKVYAVDVGYGQLNYKLMRNPRVVVFDRTNFRHFNVSLIADPIDLAVMDASFISCTKLIPKVLEVFTQHPPSLPPQNLIVLIKPQFEVGREHIGKKGVVKDEQARTQALKNISDFCEEKGCVVKGVTPSPILGAEGNQEYLFLTEYSG